MCAKTWLALDTLRTHKFRSFLTVSGADRHHHGDRGDLIIAGLRQQLVDVAEQFGTRTLWVCNFRWAPGAALTREENCASRFVTRTRWPSGSRSRGRRRTR